MAHSPSPHPNLLVARNTPSEFRAEDRTDPRFFIHGRLINGVLSFAVVAALPGGDRGTISGHEYFTALMDHFGVNNFALIKAVWIAGIDLDTNIDEFNRLTAPGTSLSDEEAAMRTWTGRRAAAYGFTNAAIQFKDGVPGAYIEVHVHFTR